MSVPASDPGTPPAELLLGGDGGHTLRATLAAARIEPVFAERAYRALGLTVPALDEPTLSAEDVAGWSLVRRLLDAGWTEDDVVGVARTAGREARRIAAAVVETFLRVPPAPEGEEAGDDVADLLALDAGTLLPALGPLLGPPSGCTCVSSSTRSSPAASRRAVATTSEARTSWSPSSTRSASASCA